MVSETSNYPQATLQCRPNSHPFQDRTFPLSQSLKVGRSVARARPAVNNAIFDCKVLSRNHALLWYENGKFFIQDTKSSNGTFVNNQRLSKGSEESLPRELCSGDILQFGVDVLENSRKVTHGCIIATLKLYLPDGKEAKASPTILSGSSTNIPLHTQDLYQLNQYIQEALAREQLLETKLAVLQKVVGETEAASEETWKSLIDEDRLLTRVEILESQLATYGKNMNEDKMREEVQRLVEEKDLYQETAKISLKKLVDEKLEAVKKVKEMERTLSNTEDEIAALRELYDKDVLESQRLSLEVNRLSSELEVLKEPKDVTEEAKMEDTCMIQNREQIEILEKKLRDMENVFVKLNITPEETSEDVNKKNVSREIADCEENLAVAERQIAKLVLVKEKYVRLSQEQQLLKADNSDLKKRMDILSYQSQTATAFGTFSLMFLLLTVIIAFLPYIAGMFGTTDNL